MTTAAAVLFIHGFGGDLDNWLFNLDALAEKPPVIALDLPGHGQSTATLPGTTIKALAAFVARFMEAIDVPQAHLVGHSMGGAVAAQLALDAPAAGREPRADLQRRPRPRDQQRLHRRLRRRGVAPRAEAGARTAVRRTRSW